MKKIAILFIILLVSSCDKELQLDLDYEGRKLAISCLINPYSPVSVSISETNDPGIFVIPVMFDRLEYVSIAQITLLEDGVELEDFTYDSTSNSFISSHFPTVEPVYQLIVDVPGYDQVISKEIRIPENRAMQVEKTPAIQKGQSRFGKSSIVKIQFSDPVDEDNLYAYRLSTGNGIFLVPDRGDSTGGFAFGYTTSLIGIYKEGCNFSNFNYTGYTFDDYCFNGLKTTIETQVTYGGTFKFNVQLFLLDPFVYQYLKNLGEYKRSIAFEEEFNLEPVRIPSSFKNAYGVFGAYHPTDTVLLFE